MKLDELLILYKKCKGTEGCLFCSERKEWTLCPMIVGLKNIDSGDTRLCNILRAIEERIKEVG